jgi:Tol biopolymer transport system component
MKERKAIVFFMLAAVLTFPVLANGAYLQQTAGELFEKALYVEEGQGDLQKAISLYQDIVRRFPGEREAAAKALLHIGICYEKLGKSEARSAYNRLLQDYGDQLQLAKEARSRLAQLEASAGRPAPDKGGLIFRKIDFKGAESTHQVRLSPDGTSILYIGAVDKPSPGGIHVGDLASGKSFLLVEGVEANVGNPAFAWSPDGKKVVFRSGFGELQVVDSSGGKPEKLWSASDEDTDAFPLDWSDRAQAILIALPKGRMGSTNERTIRLAILPEKGGEPRTVVSGDMSELSDWTLTDWARFSPDGKFVVGTKRKEKNADVYVWAVDGSGETRITDHAADDEYPFWSPDGNYIVFVSNRAKTTDLWAMPMAGSLPAGDPVRIQSDIGKDKIPADITRSGHLLFLGRRSASQPPDLFVMPVNAKTGEPQGPFRPFAKHPTQSASVRWSPDGSRIAYTAPRGNIHLANAYVSSGGTEEELELPARSYYMANIEWSRDGKSLLFPGINTADSRLGIFRISLESQNIESVQQLGETYGPNFKGAYANIRWLPLAGRYMFAKVLGETEEEIYLMDPVNYEIERVGEKFEIDGYGSPSPDGRYLVAYSSREKKAALLSLPDGASRALCDLPAKGWPAFSWSPDGKRLAWGEGRVLKIFSVPEGTVQTLVEAAARLGTSGFNEGTPNTAWSPDGTKIAYAVQESFNDSTARGELWVVNAAGGPARKIADAPSSHPLLQNIVWHPSGKLIFARGSAPETRAGMYEHWVMENFLPAAQAPVERGAGEFQVRKLWDKALDSFFMGGPSPDGKYLTYVDWEKFANLGIHDVSTGENRLLTDIKTWENGEMCYSSVFSPDGGRIAYSFQTKDMLNQLRTVNIDGSSPRILHNGTGVSYQIPIGWTADGKQILTLSWAKDETAKTAFVSAVDGSVKDVKVLSAKLPRTTSLDLSPDGKYVAITFFPKQDSANGDILLLATEGGAESTLIEHPANDRVLGWSPDGKRVFFTSDRTGTIGVWVVTVAEGKAKGTPELVRGDIGNIQGLGMTRDGKLYYGIYTGWSDIFIAPIDPATGKILGQPEKAIRKYETFNTAPDWSPDGQFLVCRSSRGKMQSETPALLIRSLQTGEVREMIPRTGGGLNFHYIRWTADGRSVLAVGLDEKGKYGALLAIGAQTGEAKIIARPESERVIYYPDRAADGKSVYFIRSGKLNQLIRLDLESGIEKELLSSSQPLGYFRFALSPDGQKMVVFEGDRIRIHSSDGTEPRELIKVKDVNTIAWTADGKNILYGKLQDGSQDVMELWGVPAAGGEPQKLGLTMTLLMHLRVSPDGKNIAFTASEQPGKTEVWVMENFLPKDK